jgi:hypothetical protein
MNYYLQEKTLQPLDEWNLEPLPSLWRPRARRRARRRERKRWEHDQVLAWHMQKIIVGLGLTRADFSIGGGRSLHTPEVVSVIAGPPTALDIRILPGQVPHDFAAHAETIAYNLGVAEVRVLPLGPLLIRLVLLSREPSVSWASETGSVGQDLR